MNNLNVIEYLLIKATEKRKISKRALMKSYISLFLMFSILSVTTFSWFSMNDTATVSSSAISVNTSSGLRVNHGEDLSSNIILSSEVKLAEASSVDGRNMFFPTTGTFPDENSNAENKMDTSKMIFREGNVGDKNTKYYYNNFTMQVESNNTEVYIKSYSVKVTSGDGKKTQVFDGSVRLNTKENMRNPEECPIRIAFIQDSSQTPVVIDPTAFISNYAKKYQAVSSTNSKGEPTTARSDAKAFSSYYFGTKNPLFKIATAGQALDATMVIWLEGTGGNCDKYAGGTVEVNIQLESNWDYMDTIKFVDEILKDEKENDLSADNRYWVDDTNCIVIMTYIDARTKKDKAVIMSQSSNYDSDHTWIAALPEDVTENISFMRYNPNEETIWNAWYTEKGINEEGYKNPLTSILKGWSEYKAQHLQENRFVTKDEKTYRSVTYKAIRGNGYGYVDKDDPDKVKKRETPCLGYWIYDDDAIGEDEQETTVPPTTQPIETTEPTTKPEETTQPTTVTGTRTVNLSLTDHVESDRNIYIVFSDGTQKQMKPQNSSNNNYYTLTDLVIDKNVTVKSIIAVKNGSQKTYYYTYTFKQDSEYRSITINNDGSSNGWG